MKRYVTAILLFIVVTLVGGCTSKRGLIELQTRPPGATVYLNQTKQGVTPVELEYDSGQPAELKIEKDGYYPESELLGKGWIVREYYKGNYAEGNFIIQGKRIKALKVSTVRQLKQKDR